MSYTKQECAFFKRYGKQISPRSYNKLKQKGSERIEKYCNDHYKADKCSNTICENINNNINPYTLKPLTADEQLAFKQKVLDLCSRMRDTEYCNCYYSAKDLAEVKKECEEFQKNQNINPKTGRKIKTGAKKQRELILRCNLCNKNIDVNQLLQGPAFNKNQTQTPPPGFSPNQVLMPSPVQQGVITSDLQQDIDRLNQELRILNDEKELIRKNLQNELNARLNELQQLQQLNNRLQNEIAQLSNSNRDANEIINEKERLLVENINRINQQENIIINLQQDIQQYIQVDEQNRETINTLNAELNKAKQNQTQQQRLTAATFTSQKILLEKQIRNLQDRLANAEQSMNQVPLSNDMEINKLQTEINGLEQQLVDVQNQNQRLNQDVKNWKGANDALEKDIRNLSERFYNLENKGRQKDIDDINRLRNELETTQNLIIELNQSILQLQNVSKADNDKISELNTIINNLEERISQGQSSQVSTQEMNTLRQQITSLQNENMQLKKDNDDLYIELAEDQEYIEQLQSNQVAPVLTQSISDLQSQLEAERATNAQLSQNIQQIQQEIEQLRTSSLPQENFLRSLDSTDENLQSLISQF